MVTAYGSKLLRFTSERSAKKTRLERFPVLFLSALRANFGRRGSCDVFVGRINSFY